MPRRRGHPDINELVVCTVEKVTQFAAWVNVEEYNLKGIIHISEVAGKWVKNIKNYIKEGKKYVCKVMKFEPKKDLVTLSLRRVSRIEKKQKMNQFRKEERAEKLLEIAAKSLNKNLDQAYEEAGYILQEKFGDLYTGLEKMKKVSREKLKKYGLTDEWIDALLEIVKKSLKEKITVMKFHLEIKSYSPNGIEKIKELMKEIEEKTESKVRYIAAPTYRLDIKTTNPKETEKKVTKYLEFLKKSKDPIFDYRRIE